MAHTLDTILKEMDRLNREIAQVKLDIIPIKQELSDAIASGQSKSVIDGLRTALADKDKMRNRLKSDWYLMNAEKIEVERNSNEAKQQ